MERYIEELVNERLKLIVKFLVMWFIELTTHTHVERIRVFEACGHALEEQGYAQMAAVARAAADACKQVMKNPAIGLGRKNDDR